MSAFTKLGRRIALVQDADRLALGATERSADAFIQGLRRKRRRRPLPLLLAAALALVAIPLLIQGLLVRQTRPFVESPSGAVSVGRAIVVPTNQTIPLRFADGSEVVLASGARASVRQLSEREVSFDFDTGAAEFTVVHRAGTHWTVQAGVYQVRVTGTRFAVDWRPDVGRFALQLVEGSVVVSTANSSHSAVRMVAPERLVVERGVWQLNPLEPAADAGARDSLLVPPASSAAPPRPSAPARMAPPRRAASAPADFSKGDDWRTLGKQGKFAEAYALADIEGMAHLSQTRSPTELLELAEICRFSGHSSQGITLLTAIRSRFPDREDSAVAAFQLGRLVRSGPQAAEWFRTYLRERPRGALAREAAGRLIEVLDRAGDHREAALAADEYLRKYPTGPHAEFARQLLTP
jgi:transmembrane sensor